MKIKHLIGILIVASAMLMSCAKVYYPEKYKTLTSNHKTLAVLPINFDLKTELNNQKPHMDNYPVDHIFGLAFRKKLIKKLQLESLSVELLNTTEIDNYFAKRIEKGETIFTIDQIPDIANDLNADALLIYCVRTPSSKKDGEELVPDFVQALITGTFAVEPTSEVKVITQIYDGKTGGLIWQFNHWNQGMYFTTPMLITNPIIREVKNRMPYSMK